MNRFAIRPRAVGRLGSPGFATDDLEHARTSLARFLAWSGWMMVALAAAVPSVAAGTRTVTLNRLEIGLDETNGGIVSMAYPKVGRILATDARSAGLVDVAFPIADYVPMRLGTRFSRAVIEEAPASVTITWSVLAPSRTHVKLPEGSATARVTLAAAPDGRSVLMRCRIENRFGQPIPQILFPDFTGLQPVGTSQSTKLTMARGTVTPFKQRSENRHRAAFWPVDSGWRIYEATSYSYGPNVMNWLDYGSLTGGFSLFQKKWRDRDYRRPDILTYVSERQPNSLRLALWQPGKVDPGETWESPEHVLTPHEGGWAKGIETYRQYVAQVNPPREVPRHIREGLGYLSIWMSDQHETVPELAAIRFKDVPRIAQDAKDHGIDEIAAWRWCFHLRMPIRHRPVLGAAEEWIQAVRDARAIGVNVSGAVGLFLLSHTQLPRYGVNYTQRSAWNFHRDLIPNFNPSYMRGQPFDHAGQGVPPSNPVWQEDVVKSLTEWMDRGLTSFTWDVFGRGPDGFLSTTYENDVALIATIKRVRAHARALDPDSTFNAETISITGPEWDGEVLDYTWNWMMHQVKEGHLTTTDYPEYVEAGPIHNVLRSPRFNTIVQDSPVALKKAFADGAYINFLLRKPDGENGSAIPGEKPLLSPAVKQAAARRRQFLPFFTDGVLIGDGLLSEPAQLFVRSHVAGDRALTVIVNDGETPQNTDLVLNPTLWLPAGAHRVKRYDADGRHVSTADISFAKDQLVRLPGRTLDAGEMEFFVIE